ncbi:MAG: hypothetical protein FLDDKLPJ_02287 [Phycisphaerae bacterium]|nr:hypothetical protein [Phycisphaerae bacterium]
MNAVVFADESVDGPIVAWLRGQGWDVVWGAERCPGASDDEVVRLAMSDTRVILTADRDFGELVFRGGCRPAGVVLSRLRAPTSAALLEAFKARWAMIQHRLSNHFIVLTESAIRSRRIPPPG